MMFDPTPFDGLAPGENYINIKQGVTGFYAVFRDRVGTKHFFPAPGEPEYTTLHEAIRDVRERGFAPYDYAVLAERFGILESGNN